MVYGPKFLWELLEKGNNEKRKLKTLQKPIEVQLNEAICDKVNAKIDSTVPNEMRTILAKSLRHQSFL